MSISFTTRRRLVRVRRVLFRAIPFLIARQICRQPLAFAGLLLVSSLWARYALGDSFIGLPIWAALSMSAAAVFSVAGRLRALGRAFDP